MNRSSHSVRNILFDVYYFSSMPRLLLEVFVRKNFGYDYFSLFRCFQIAFILLIIPWIGNFWNLIFALPKDREPYVFIWSQFILHHATYYVFIAAFIVTAFRRYAESSRLQGDPDMYSEYPGDRHLWFTKMKNGQMPNWDYIEQVQEPRLFLIIGIVLLILQQPVGWVLIICSVIYSIGYRAQDVFYRQNNRKRNNAKIMAKYAKQAMIEEQQLDSAGVVVYSDARPTSQDIEKQAGHKRPDSEFYDAS